MSISTSVHDIKTLILSYHPVIAVETVEEERVRGLLAEVGTSVGMPVFEWSLTKGLARWPEGKMIHGTGDPQAMLRHLECLTVEAIFLLKDFSSHLTQPGAARQFRELCQKFFRTRSTVVLSGESVQVPAEIEHKVAFYSLKLPGKDELKEVLQAVIQSLKGNHRFRIDLAPGDLSELLRALGGLTLNQARQAVAYSILEDGRLDSQDIARVLERKAQAIREGGLLEYFPVADNRTELGGFANLKRWLERAAVGFSPQAEKLNLSPPRGIMIVGVQGCGKSLAAKAIARQWRIPLLKLDAGRLYDKFVGESEKNFRKAVAMAESMAPAVLWIDEIEKGFGGGGDQDGGLSKRLLGSFLTWMQEKRRDVFVVATANDLSALPPEFLRKGRFDETFFVDLPDESEREGILRIHLKLRNQPASKFDLKELVSATEGFSGAEIEQAVIAALYRALHQKRALDTGLLLEEIRQTVPLSVSRREDIQQLRRSAQGRFVSVR